MNFEQCREKETNKDKDMQFLFLPITYCAVYIVAQCHILFIITVLMWLTVF